MIITDEELLRLHKLKHDLLRQIDKPFSSDNLNVKEELIIELNNVELQIRKRTKTLIDDISIKQIKELDKQSKEEELQMAKEKEIKKAKSSGRKPQTDSLASHIEAGLLQKGLKDIDAVADFVYENKSGDKDKIKKQIKAIIAQVKKGVQKRWQKYEWNEKLFRIELKK